MTAASLRFELRHFDDLGVRALYALLRLRQEVFVIEQACPYLDADGVDPHCHHLLGWSADGALLAGLRIVPPGLKYEEASIGRVVSALSHRGTGLGRALMGEGLRAARSLHPGHGVRISAQARLQRFYEDFGFVAVGEAYLEDNIPHLEMRIETR